ncbi:hypothetical protein [Flammeovirga kamogawensis]|uniref:Uncharacterized protein n=1 Tax=Flammeovirga kamogawensis TaxID=373891 RepID=A0ABX8H1S6_9BACT|nr:hypothetical protein [Flammeovirga kamogawensis]MBB6463942.1 membrane protein YdbS with pleckstrin-like domain [Flammeovirga kamogawensis]QWG09780.1 hypothetical protein KM029_19055 [Flammeovirga kamogawensis]TRX65290.1 hypothetical protein EO216_22465 [Flammeovirga kamogawensis]
MKAFFILVIKKILFLVVALFESAMTIFFLASMVASSVFYYVVRIVTWPYRFLRNGYLHFFGSKEKKSLYTKEPRKK